MVAHLGKAVQIFITHGGYIWTESKEGEGAIFKVLLPAE
jgi:signal transduction histidine kinase